MADIGIRVIVLGVAEARRNVGAVQSDINGLEGTIRRVSGTTATFGRDVTAVGQALIGFGRTLTIAVTAPIAAAGAALVDAGIDFQHAFAGVTKTVDGLADEFGHLTGEGMELRDEFIALSQTMPVHPNALAALGQLAGQFGQTRETVLDMVKVLAMLQETTDLVGEGAQQAFAQVAEIAGLTAAEFDNMASALVFLGNHFPTTESRIISFTERIIGTATALGLSIDQVLAWGAAVTSSGIQAETGATALRKAFLEMALAVTTATGGVVDNTAAISEQAGEVDELQRRIAIATQRQNEFTDSTRESTRMANQFQLDQLNADLADHTALMEGLQGLHGKVFQAGSEELQTFARVLTQAFKESGLAADEFASKFGILPEVLEDGVISGQEFADIFKNNASSALELFINGLSTLDATTQIATLDSLGLSAQRVGSTLQNLAVNNDVLRAALEGAAEAYEEGIALQEEFTKRTATVQSELSKLRNQFVALGITIFDLVEDDLRRLISGLGDLIDYIIKLDPAILRNIVLFAALAAAVGPLLIILGGIIAAVGAMITAFAALATPLGLAAIAIAAIGAALAVAFAPEIFNQIRSIIDALNLVPSIVSAPTVEMPESVGDINARIAQARGAGMGTTANPNLGGVNAGMAQSRGANGMVPVDTSIGDINQQISSMRGQGQELPIPEPTALERVLGLFNEIKRSIAEITQSGGFLTFIASLRTLGEVAKAVGLAISQTMGPQITEVINELNNTMSSLGLSWGDIWNALKTLIVGVVLVIGAVLLGLLSIILGVLNGAINAWNTFFTSLQGILTGLSMIIEGFIRIVAGNIATLVGLFNLIKAVIEGDRDGINAALNQISAGFREVFAGIVQILHGSIMTILSLVGLLVGTVVAFFAGMWEAILLFWGNLWANLTGDTENGVLAIGAWFGDLASSIPAIINTMVQDLLRSFEDLYQQLVGGSIVPDMVRGIIDSITGLKDTVLQLAGELVEGVIGFFEGMATRVGDLLGNIFGGGGGEGFKIPEINLGPIIAAVELVKLKFAELVALMPVLATTFIASFIQPTIVSIMLLVSTFDMQMLHMQTTFAATTLAMTALWAAFSLAFLAQTLMMLQQGSALFTSFRENVISNLNQIRDTFSQMTDSIVSDLARIDVSLALTEVAIGRAEAVIDSARANAVHDINAISNAFHMLAQAAWSGAAAVVAALAVIATTAKAAHDNVTSSPTLTLQHPFERFEKFLKDANFSFSMDMGGTDSIISALNAASMPAGSTTTTTNVDRSNNVNVTGVPMRDEGDLIDLMNERLLFAGN